MKTPSILCALSALLVTLPLHAEPTGLVSRWQAENNATDTLGHNNGAISGTAGYAPGVFGSAFSFSNSGYVGVTNPTFNTYASGFTVMAWIKISAYNNAASVVNQRNPANSSGFTLEQSFGNPGTLLWAVNQTGVAEGFSFLSAPGWQLNTFYHVAATLDATNGTMALYRDGVLVAATNNLPHTNMVTQPANGFQIGQNIVAAQFGWNGLIDDTRFYDHALTPTEIASLAEPGICDWVFWPGNSHYYRVATVTNGITWTNAQLAAQGFGGYLVTPASGTENAFVFSLISNTPALWYIDGANNGIGPWTGGLQPAGSGEPGGGWTWVTGEPYTFSPWSPGEPNNSGGTEDRICYFGQGTLINSNWNDLTATVMPHGFVVERPTAPTCSGSNTLVFTPFCTNLTVTLNAATTNCVVTTNTGPGAVVTNGLAGWWRADGNALDSSGNTNTGTLQNGATFTTGQQGQAFSFQTNIPAQHVSVGTLPGLTGAANLTLAGYVRLGGPATAINRLHIFSQAQWAGAVNSPCGGGFLNIGMDFAITTNLLVLSYGSVNGTVTNVCVTNSINYTNIGLNTLGASSSTVSIPTNQWVHAAIVWQRTAGTVTHYLNGNIVGSINVSPEPAIAAAYSNATAIPLNNVGRFGDAVIGAHTYASAGNRTIEQSTLAGSVDNLRVYSRALAQGEIQQIMNVDALALTNLVSTNCTTTNATTTNLLFCAASGGKLKIVKAMPNVELRWASATNAWYLLQGSDEVGPLNWTNIGTAVSGNGSNIVVPQVTLPPRRFYRLLGTE